MSTNSSKKEVVTENLLADLEEIKTTLNQSGSDISTIIPVLETIVGKRTTIQEKTTNPFLSSKVLEQLIAKRNEAEAHSAEEIANLKISTNNKNLDLFEQHDDVESAKKVEIIENTLELSDLVEQFERVTETVIDDVLISYMPQIQMALKVRLHESLSEWIKQLSSNQPTSNITK